MPDGDVKLQQYRVTTQKDDPPLPGDAVGSGAYEVEDEFRSWYIGAADARGLIAPPHNLRQLERRCMQNNTISPCVEAMVTCVDGTGFVFVKDSDVDNQPDMTDPKVNALYDFFGEPYPGESFLAQRRKLRRDIEQIGNGYLEVIPNAQDQIVFLRHADAKMVRIMVLDEPVVAKKTVVRDGKPVDVRTQVRERRFAMIGFQTRLRYFAEFGASRDLDKDTGKWAQPGQRLPWNKRATQLIHFIALPDEGTPYGIPRWVSQTPSVLGSRKAEEFNLDFFDNGGVPPIMIFLQGGALTPTSRQAIEERVGQGAKRANRVQVIEAEPTSGALDAPGTARITVERFGAERQNDSMFEKYDDKCELRTRRAWRMPPIFVGAASDYSFATAYASYTVAEAQVFKPERGSFDEVISLKLLPALGFPGYRMRSLPLAINDITHLLQAIELAGKTDQVDPKQLVSAINEAANLSLKVSNVPVLGFGQVAATLNLSAPGVNTNPPAAVNRNRTAPTRTRPAASTGTPNGNPRSPGNVKKADPAVEVARAALALVYPGLDDDDLDGLIAATANALAGCGLEDG